MFTLFYILQIWAQRFNVFQDYELNQILTFIKYPKPEILLQHQKVDNQMSNWLYPFKAWVCFVFDAFFFKKKKKKVWLFIGWSRRKAKLTKQSLTSSLNKKKKKWDSDSCKHFNYGFCLLVCESNCKQLYPKVRGKYLIWKQ